MKMIVVGGGVGIDVTLMVQCHSLIFHWWWWTHFFFIIITGSATDDFLWIKHHTVAMAGKPFGQQGNVVVVVVMTVE